MTAFTPEHLLPDIAAFPEARICWVAYSGGVDSTVMLHALAAVGDRVAPEIHALHVDHGLHPDSRAWSEHCVRACARLGVALQTRRIRVSTTPGESLEAVARHGRYRIMAELLGPGDLMLTAQHRDDQAETLLLALMRGSGPKGLAAMPRVTRLGSGRLVRPLLEVGRTELLAYAESQGLDWIEDPSNEDLDFDRNFLRRRILPALKERWSACAKSISRSAAHCAEAQELVESFAGDEAARAAGHRPGTLSITRLGALALPLRKAVLRHWIRERGLPTPDSRHLGRVLSEVMGARADASPLVAWQGCEVRRYRDDLFALGPMPPLPGPEPIQWRGGILDLPDRLGSLELLAVNGRSIDPTSLFPEGLAVRFGVTGLNCRREQGGHRKPVRKLYQEAGFPPWVRPYIPLLFAADRLIAVGGTWICQTGVGGGEKQFRVSWRPDSSLWCVLDRLAT
jgi:tRNA(Ile)-lysidine synthase